MQSLPKVVFIGAYTEQNNYLLKMAAAMATHGYPVDFILEKHDKELELEVPFKINVVGKSFRWSSLQSLWVYFKIMRYTLRNITKRCIYIVEDTLLVPVFKFLGNQVVYCKQNMNNNTTMDAIIGNVCLSKANLILMPLNNKRLLFQKIAVVDSSNVASGVEAVTSLLYNTLPARICAMWMEKKSEETQGKNGAPITNGKLQIIVRKDHENEDVPREPEFVDEAATAEQVEDKGPSRTESDIEESEDVEGESEAAGTVVTINTPPREIGNATAAAGAKNQESEKVLETITPTQKDEEPAEGAEPVASTSSGRKTPDEISSGRYKGIFKDVRDVEIDRNVQTIYDDQFENIQQYYVPLTVNFEDAGVFLERERAQRDEDQRSVDSEVSILLE